MRVRFQCHRKTSKAHRSVRLAGTEPARPPCREPWGHLRAGPVGWGTEKVGPRPLLQYRRPVQHAHLGNDFPTRVRSRIRTVEEIGHRCGNHFACYARDITPAARTQRLPGRCVISACTQAACGPGQATAAMTRQIAPQDRPDGSTDNQGEGASATSHGSKHNFTFQNLLAISAGLVLTFAVAELPIYAASVPSVSGAQNASARTV